MTKRPLTFQDAVARLQSFWAECGCVVWLPHNVEVGAGTMNPGTFLHVLGPEPWNVVYVEPSIRPDDARYGENPNRMGRHHQIQVILKPEPGDPQALYLRSLEAIGIDLSRHDVRFVEDNWESPALGAWGLGWEVWLDGLEITQFTYFQQAGSLDCDPVSVEITYGLERILMALQDVRHFKDIAWNEHLRFGDVLLSYEQQTSRYYFEHADVERLRRLYDDSEAEAVMALEQGLTLPAHDYVLRCSHLFNVLDARGAVGVTERARFFGRMRRLSRQVAESYVAERERLGFPLLAGEDRPPWVARDASVVASDAKAPASAGLPSEAATFGLEVGTEELPVDELESALSALRSAIPAWLGQARLEHGEVSVHGTPRRLLAVVRDLAPRQRDLETEVVGPPVTAGYDADGRPTKAAEGFSRSVGISVESLQVVERGGERRLAGLRREAGRPTAEVLVEGLPAILEGLPFARAMRWNASGSAFSRPVRWIVALLGQAIVPVQYAGVTAGRTTRGLRCQGSRRLDVASAEDLPKLLRSAGVLVEPAARRTEVLRQVTATAEALGGRIGDEDALVREVANLVEQPAAIAGAFDADYLRLPVPVLVTVLRKHQRCFPVLGADGGLMARFVAVANGASVDIDAVRHGNEAVVHARFADAAYFWDRDTSLPLASFTPQLEGLMFQADLGSVLDKVHRLARIVPELAPLLCLSPSEAAAAERAVMLSKSDLATAMVVDFTSLQGVMGREYALRSGESPEVATAIYEQYLPRGAGDDVPSSPAGTALALADRLDSLVGLFAVGLRPTGAQDPYGLRRAALGIASILAARGGSFDLREAIALTARAMPVPVDAACRAELLAFFARRLEGSLRDAGHPADVVSAVLAVHAHDPWTAARNTELLALEVRRDGWIDTLTAYARCARIVRGRDDVADAVDPGGFVSTEERVLHEAVRACRAEVDAGGPQAALDALRRLAPVVNAFFDAVLVMAEDEAVRANRLALVRLVDRLPSHVADLRLLEGS